MRQCKGHIFLSLEQLAGNSCKIPENALCPTVIMSPVIDLCDSVHTVDKKTTGLSVPYGSLEHASAFTH